MPEDALPLMGALAGQSFSEIGGKAPPPAEWLSVADEGADVEASAEALVDALAPAQPGVPSPMPLPRSASWHCWAKGSPQMPSPQALACSWAAAKRPACLLFGSEG